MDLLFRFEIDNCLYAGFCVSKNGEPAGQQLSKDEINDLLDDCKDKIGGWWIYWEYLPQENVIPSPNFKAFNEVYLDLFDENKFEQFIDLCEISISNILGKLK